MERYHVLSSAYPTKFGEALSGHPQYPQLHDNTFSTEVEAVGFARKLRSYYFSGRQEVKIAVLESHTEAVREIRP